MRTIEVARHSKPVVFLSKMAELIRAFRAWVGEGDLGTRRLSWGLVPVENETGQLCVFFCMEPDETVLFGLMGPFTGRGRTNMDGAFPGNRKRQIDNEEGFTFLIVVVDVPWKSD